MTTNGLPHVKTEIRVEGFPRSGNTYLFHALTLAFPTVLVLRGNKKVRSIRSGEGDIICLRDPVETLISVMSYDMEEHAEHTARDYEKGFFNAADKLRTYLQAMLETEESVLVVTLSSFAGDINKVLTDVSNRIPGLPKPVHVHPTKIVDAVNRYDSTDRPVVESSVEHRGHLPNEARTASSRYQEASKFVRQKLVAGMALQDIIDMHGQLLQRTNTI